MKYLFIGLLLTTSAFAGTCQTTSNGYNFNHSSRDDEFSRKKALQSCQANSYTNNEECVANLTCDSDPVRTPVTCDTSSNQYRFSTTSLNAEFSEEATIKKCQANSYTDNAECVVNIACDNHSAPEFGSCRTSSRGYNFVHTSRNEAFSAEKAVKNCQANSYTDNEECEVNLECGI